MSQESSNNPTSGKSIVPGDNHWAVFINNTSDKSHFIEGLLSGLMPKELEVFKGLKGGLFSKIALDKLIDEESRHGKIDVTGESLQSLQSMSSGEQKKVLLRHVLNSKPDFIILDNPFDNLDKDTQIDLKQVLSTIRKDVAIIQIISRKDDLLPFIINYSLLNKRELVVTEKSAIISNEQPLVHFNDSIPKPLKPIEYDYDTLIELKGVNVSYNKKPIVKDINWKIGKGEFWELSGKNGSGKTTLLTMITGENPKGYGQDLFLFGYKKGSGESIWDIKKNIGYFTPSMTDKFLGYHTVHNMMISGIMDSIGLYVRPTEAQLRIAKEWLQLINMWHLKDIYFHDLTMGQQRMLMTTRAMVKHPLLLILDEPTAGLDDTSAELLISLVNKMSKESDTSIIFVSHRQEAGLRPDYRFMLITGENGSIGSQISEH